MLIVEQLIGTELEPVSLSKPWLNSATDPLGSILQNEELFRNSGKRFRFRIGLYGCDRGIGGNMAPRLSRFNSYCTPQS